MSYAIKVAKAGYMGDPGLFGFIGSALGGIAKVAVGAAGGLLTGGPLGAISGGIRAVLPSARPQVLVSTPTRGATMTAANIPMVSARPGMSLAAIPKLPTPAFPMMPVGQPFGYGPGNQTQSGTGVTGPLVGTPSAVGCARGFHHNKTGYFTKRYGWIAPGTVCVKNRRRNPLNARALSRSMARLSSAKKATDFLKRVSIRPRKCSGCK